MPKADLFGYSTFNDVEDPELRARNRAQVILNMMTDPKHLERNGKITLAGAALIVGYFNKFPKEEQGAVLKKWREAERESA